MAWPGGTAWLHAQQGHSDRCARKQDRGELVSVYPRETAALQSLRRRFVHAKNLAPDRGCLARIAACSVQPETATPQLSDGTYRITALATADGRRPAAPSFRTARRRTTSPRLPDPHRHATTPT